MFVDRQEEIVFLNDLLNRKHPGPAQLILMYGRRRVGKSELLMHWAAQSGLDLAIGKPSRKPPPNNAPVCIVSCSTSRICLLQHIAPGLNFGMPLRLNCKASAEY